MGGGAAHEPARQTEPAATARFKVSSTTSGECYAIFAIILYAIVPATFSLMLTHHCAVKSWTVESISEHAR